MPSCGSVMSASRPEAVAVVPDGRCGERRVSFGTALLLVVVALRSFGEGTVVVLWPAQPARLSTASATSASRCTRVGIR